MVKIIILLLPFLTAAGLYSQKINIQFSVSGYTTALNESELGSFKWDGNLTEDDYIEIKIINKDSNIKFKFKDVAVQLIFLKEIKRQFGPIFVGENSQWAKRFAIIRELPFPITKEVSKKRNLRRKAEFPSDFLQEPVISIPYKVFSQSCLSRTIFIIKEIEYVDQAGVNFIKLENEYSFYCACEPCGTE